MPPREEQVGRGKGHGEDRDRQQEGDFQKKTTVGNFTNPEAQSTMKFVSLSLYIN